MGLNARGSLQVAARVSPAGGSLACPASFSFSTRRDRAHAHSRVTDLLTRPKSTYSRGGGLEGAIGDDGMLSYREDGPPTLVVGLGSGRSVRDAMRSREGYGLMDDLERLLREPVACLGVLGEILRSTWRLFWNQVATDLSFLGSCQARFAEITTGDAHSSTLCNMLSLFSRWTFSPMPEVVKEHKLVLVKALPRTPERVVNVGLACHRR